MELRAFRQCYMLKKGVNLITRTAFSNMNMKKEALLSLKVFKLPLELSGDVISGLFSCLHLTSCLENAHGHSQGKSNRSGEEVKAQKKGRRRVLYIYGLLLPY